MTPNILSMQALFELPDQEFVVECYRSILQREPDSDGLAHFLSRVLKGESRLSVAAIIASSEEARKLPLPGKGLIAEILEMHARTTVEAASTKRQRQQAAEVLSRYLSVISGFEIGGRDHATYPNAALADPFSTYLHGVIEGSN